MTKTRPDGTAIISFDYWQRAFALDPHALGSTILISDTPYTIVGVLPRGFLEPKANSAEVWTSFALYLEGPAPSGKDRNAGIVEVVGRLKPGVTAEQARADLSAIQSGLAQSNPENRFRSAVTIQSKLADVTGDVRPALLLLMAAVLAVLLIVCTNVAGLMLSQTVRRRGEMALRAALGASRWRVCRQLMMEALLLGLVAGVAGTALAYLLLHVVLPLVPKDIPRVGEVCIDARVLCFTIAISVACAVFSSLFPAWKFSHAEPIEVLRESGRSATSGRRTRGLQNSLVIVQTALGFVLLLASGLLIRGFLNVRNVNTGFNAEHLMQFDLPLTPTRYPDAKKVLFYNQLLPKLAGLPGVHRVSAGYPLPLQGWYASVPVEIDSRPYPPDNPASTLAGETEPGFFETLGIPLVRGRTFTAADNDPKSPFVAIVNQAFAKRYFPDENPVGRHIRPDLRRARNTSNDLDPTALDEREIVGVVADVAQDSIIDSPQPFAVFPYAQASALARPRVVLRVAGDPMRYQKPVQAVVSSIDPSLFLIGVNSVIKQVGQVSSTQRFETILVSAFAGVALFLTALGLYATLTVTVASRTREIGLRMALGADRSGVAMLVINRAARLLLVGECLGGVSMLVASRMLAASDWWRPLLFGVSWFEPTTYTLILLVLGVVSIAACLVPTWRAVRVDPICALRDD